MTKTQGIAAGDRIYATEIIDYYDFKIYADASGTVLRVTDGNATELLIDWDAGVQGMADSGSVALIFDLAAWFAMRGIERDSNAMTQLLAEYAGKTEDEMDAIYDAMHGSTA